MGNPEPVGLLMRASVRNSISSSDGFGCSGHILNDPEKQKLYVNLNYVFLIKGIEVSV